MNIQINAIAFLKLLAALEIDSIEAPTTKAVVAATTPVPDGGGGEAVVVNGVADEGSCCSEEQAAADGDGNVATKPSVKKATISATTRYWREIGACMSSSSFHIDCFITLDLFSEC